MHHVPPPLPSIAPTPPQYCSACYSATPPPPPPSTSLHKKLLIASERGMWGDLSDCGFGSMHPPFSLQNPLSFSTSVIVKTYYLSSFLLWSLMRQHLKMNTVTMKTIATFSQIRKYDWSISFNRNNHKSME